jgi:DNA invertase Pin-like site-specific DNA recombinase
LKYKNNAMAGPLTARKLDGRNASGGTRKSDGEDRYMARTVTMIPPSVNSRFSNLAVPVHKKRRVAAYARVSTDSDAQQTSYEAQVAYYTKYIKERPDWIFISIYTDEGISATTTKRRDGFNQMLQDALNGRIDLIITKSVSRFARNTVDSLTAIRKLKEKNVEVYFEKEGIWTFDAKGELLITIMSSLAQEESRSISENVTWGKRKSAADGKVYVAYSHFLGYRKGEDGTMQVIPEEAVIVRQIYMMFLKGMTPHTIAATLTKQGIPTPTKKKAWQPSTVLSILSNEKYKGDALLQKTFTIDFLIKKIKRNEGEVPQFYVENSHEGIIDAEDFDLVQAELARRKALGKSYRGVSCFSSKLVCSDCGGFYGSKVWHSTDKYRRTIWQCNGKFKNSEKCTTPHLTEDEIKERFMAAWNTIDSIREETIANCRLAIDSLFDFSALDEAIRDKLGEIEVLTELSKRHINENAIKQYDQAAYQKRYNELLEKYHTLSAELVALEQQRTERKLLAARLTTFVNTMEQNNQMLATFSETLWSAVVEKAIVHPDGIITFMLIDGTEIKA